MERVEELLQNTTVRQRLWAIACMATVSERGQTRLQHLAGYCISPTQQEAEQVARQLTVKRWPDSDQWDAWVEEIPDRVIVLAANHIERQQPESRAAGEDGG